jgi:hypothetical protein
MWGTIAFMTILWSFYYLFSNAKSIRLDSGGERIFWIQSQNGNDDEAIVDINRAESSHEKLNYSVEKYIEIGVIVLPDAKTIFPSWLDGRKIKDLTTAPLISGLTIIDHNKTSNMDGLINCIGSA